MTADASTGVTAHQAANLAADAVADMTTDVAVAMTADTAADVAVAMTADMTTDDLNIETAVEALLFVSDEPVSAAALAKILACNPSEVDTALTSLATRLEEDERGIQLREVAGGWRLYSHPAYHDLIERYVISWDTRSLSQAALEALAVVAYHQPTTRAGVNGIRGVNSDAVISSLVEKGLVREAGRDNGPGNAILYATTRTFLEKFGLKSLKDLPPLEDFAPDEESRSYIRARLSAGENAFSPEDDEDTRRPADDDEDDAGDGAETEGTLAFEDAGGEDGAGAEDEADEADAAENGAGGEDEAAEADDSSTSTAGFANEEEEELELID